MRREIGFEKDPSSASFGARYETAFSPRTDFLWVHTQEFRCFLEVESLHGPLHWFLSLSAKRFGDSPSADWSLGIFSCPSAAGAALQRQTCLSRRWPRA